MRQVTAGQVYLEDIKPVSSTLALAINAGLSLLDTPGSVGWGVLLAAFLVDGDQDVRHLIADAGRRLLGAGADVRRADHLRQFEQLAVRQRLVLKDIQRGAGHLARADGVVQRFLVDHAAAGAVDDADAIFHLGDHLGVDHVLWTIR